MLGKWSILDFCVCVFILSHLIYAWIVSLKLGKRQRFLLNQAFNCVDMIGI
uniref:Uncharacterized protein n=1 Tax=Rhizophora mucronata TaxID=61149 RepID=A0A2P2NI37_RHIMU